MDNEEKNCKSTEADKKFIKRLVKELDLNKPQREALHRAISHKKYTSDVVRAIAEAIKRGQY